MPTIRNVSGGPQLVSALDLHVPADGEVEITEEQAEALKGHPYFAIVEDKPKRSKDK